MYLLGQDIGYSNVKLAGGPPSGMDLHMRCPAGAGPARDAAEGLAGARLGEGVRVDIRGETWIAGVEPHRFAGARREIHSDYAKTALYHALAVAGIGHAHADKIDLLVTGLPVSLFKNKDNQAALRKLLAGRHSVQNGRTIQVEQVIVAAQPLGAFAEAQSHGADPDIMRNGRVAVIDCGFYSVDWVLIDGGAVNGQSAGTSLQAMSRVIEAIDHLIQAEHGDSPGTNAIESALRNEQNSVLLYGQRLKLHDYMQRARTRVASSALAEMRRDYRQESPVDLFILTGGGAGDYRAALTDAYPRSPIYVSTEPATANARGYWDLARRRVKAQA